MPLETSNPELQSVGHYDLVEKIADGGMGTVYKGRHRHTQQIVAIKVVPPHLASNPVLLKRFEQEYTAANALDAQAAYESMMSLWGCLMGGAHLVIHGAGWMHGGLTASFEKLVLDAELLGMMQSYFRPIAVTEEALSLDAIAEAGVGGHFFGTAQTLAQYETAFHPPMLSNWDNYPTWLARGAEEAPARANRIWKDLLAAYEPPPIDPGTVEALEAFVARRKAEGGAPTN